MGINLALRSLYGYHSFNHVVELLFDFLCKAILHGKHISKFKYSEWLISMYFRDRAKLFESHIPFVEFNSQAGYDLQIAHEK